MRSEKQAAQASESRRITKGERLRARMQVFEVAEKYEGKEAEYLLKGNAVIPVRIIRYSKSMRGHILFHVEPVHGRGGFLASLEDLYFPEAVS